MEVKLQHFSSLTLMVLFFVLVLSFSASASSSSFISGDVVDLHASSGRRLLQARKPCPVNFEFMNYTIITSQCKGPQYTPKLCCGAFREFACPYAEYLNDLTNDCASTMFSYINLYGKYPPGLFANECQGSKRGLECPAIPPAEAADARGDGIAYHPSMLLILTASFLGLLFQL